MHARRFLPTLTFPLVAALSGCGYVHVGRLPEAPTTVVGDDKLMHENSDLRLEKKMLQQELALTRAQGEALRTALENRAADGETTKRLVERLNETTRELATLRTNYAKLQAENQPRGDNAPRSERLSETEEKLAASLRNYTELQQEIERLRSEVTRTRLENISLGRQVKLLTLQNEKAQAALAQLNTELLAQKDARVRAEQDAETLRTELKNVAPNSSVLARQRTGSAAEARSLAAESPTPVSGAKASASAAEIAAAGASGAGVAALHPSGVSARLVANVSGATRSAATRDEAAAATRFHTVGSGDTLAKISAQYYGTPSRWSDILAANRDILGRENNLVIGRTLRIP